MKITKPGKKVDLNPTYVAVCYACGCEFQYKSAEADFIGWNQRDGDYHAVTCPECKNPFTVYNISPLA